MNKKKQKVLVPENNVIVGNPGHWTNRILIGTPCTGSVRMEWVMARYGQIIPTNWSATDHIQFMTTFAPMRYLVADAQNLIVRTVIEKDFQWLLLIESDNILPPDAFIRINQYMRDEKTPIVSGLYFTKSDPPEPLVYRGRGNSFFMKWKMGDLVWADGVPTGFLLVHASILKAMWEESPEYMLGTQLVRRIFPMPEKKWYDPETGSFHLVAGTSDLAFCERVIKEKFFEKASWPAYQKKEFPFLVDTNIFLKHIDENGRIFPLKDPKEYGF